MKKDKTPPQLFLGDYAPAPMLKQVVVIGAEQFMDFLALSQITNWLLDHPFPKMRDRGERLLAKLFVPFNMTTNPELGDAIDHISDEKQVDMVIALHLRGLDRDLTEDRDVDAVYARILAEHDGSHPDYYYAGRNHELLSVCLERGIPLICWGDQPVSKYRRLPKNASRTMLGAVPNRPTKYLNNGKGGVTRKIYLYEAI